MSRLRQGDRPTDTCAISTVFSPIPCTTTVDVLAKNLALMSHFKSDRIATSSGHLRDTAGAVWSHVFLVLLFFFSLHWSTWPPYSSIERNSFHPRKSRRVAWIGKCHQCPNPQSLNSKWYEISFLAELSHSASSLSDGCSNRSLQN